LVWKLLAVESYDPVFSYDLNQCVTISWDKAPQYPIVANKEYRVGIWLEIKRVMRLETRV